MYFSKQDLTNKEELPGAHIEIKDKETGETIDEWVSTDTPHIIKKLVEGRTYIMIETQVPKGYRISEEVEFVAKHGTTITMYDEYIHETPKTGDNSNIFLWFGLTCGSVLFPALLYALERRKKKKSSY